MPLSTARITSTAWSIRPRSAKEAIVTFCHLKGDLTAFITDCEPPKEYVDLCNAENVKLRYE